MTLKFKNRIAFFNTLAAATSTFLVFVVVYAVVYSTAYRHLDGDIQKEKDDILKNIAINGDRILLQHSQEWDEKEHEQVEVNPTFVQITDKNGALVFQSSNMKNRHLKFDPAQHKTAFFDQEFNNQQIRQGQFPIWGEGKQVVGQLTIGVSQVESAMVLQNLLLTLLIAFPLLTLIFYWASSFAAAQGIAPIHQLIQTAQAMDDQTMGSRLPLPARHDEIYKLATTINELLTRIENSLKREKQITADISHELRTPLTGIRGTLEVLLRKRREPEQYESKIEQVIQETDRMNKMLEQLLQLSRIEAGNIPVLKEQVDLSHFFDNFLQKWQPLFGEKQMTVGVTIAPETMVYTDAGLLELIIGNLVSNALKYGNPGGKINIAWYALPKALVIEDDGPGIPAAYLPYIFDRFYRTDLSRNAKIPGTGLGLSIAKKLADLQGIRLTVKSEEGKGTTFVLQILE